MFGFLEVVWCSVGKVKKLRKPKQEQKNRFRPYVSMLAELGFDTCFGFLEVFVLKVSKKHAQQLPNPKKKKKHEGPF